MSIRPALLGAALARPAAAAKPEWHLVPTGPYSLNNKQDALAFGILTVGLYGNGTGRVFRAEDAGAHWRPVWHHPGTSVRALDMADADTGFMGDVGPGYFDGVTDARRSSSPTTAAVTGGRWRRLRGSRSPGSAPSRC